MRLLLCRPNRTGLRASSRNTAAQARFASAQRVIFSTWCWGSPGEKVARKAFELEPSIFLEWGGRSCRHAWSSFLDALSLFRDTRAFAVALPRRTQCAPTANVGGTRRHRTAELAHGITLVGWARLASIMSGTSLLELPDCIVVFFFYLLAAARVEHVASSLSEQGRSYDQPISCPHGHAISCGQPINRARFPRTSPHEVEIS